jgi:hypothetical protein
VLVLLVNLGIAVGLSNDPVLAYRINCLVCGLWWCARGDGDWGGMRSQTPLPLFPFPHRVRLGFACFTWAWLKPRPGPPLPPGSNPLTLPWVTMGRTLSHVRELPLTFTFLFAW